MSPVHTPELTANILSEGSCTEEDFAVRQRGSPEVASSETGGAVRQEVQYKWHAVRRTTDGCPPGSTPAAAARNCCSEPTSSRGEPE